jgi:SAM-dependent methyltransferase
MSALPVREAYRRWAATYDDAGPLLALEERAFAALERPRGGRVLDAACGTARRLPEQAVGVDLVFEMLAAGRRRMIRRAARVVAGDVTALPLASGSFASVWCRLAAGYVAPLAGLYAELARVAAPGANVLVTDFHPEAIRRGHQRTFRDADGRWHRVEHVLHAAEDHERAAAAARLFQAERLELAIDEDARPLFEAAGEAARFAALEGLPVVLAYRFEKRA